ncbi:hypothetical protein HK101_000942 [Irineochytrium annulatum]|nr:hypothetical protein HK101_000942 [Irineochytrium annulatum]
MVVRIRLARWGARNNPFFGIVVANAKAASTKKHLERVGTYNPIPDRNTGVKHIEMNWDRIKYWLGVGAQPSSRVAWLLEKANLMPPLPKQLHNTGALSLNDPKTWFVSYNAPDGSVRVMTGEEARDFFHDRPAEAARLPRDQLIVKREKDIDFTKVKLDGTPPLEPLTDMERLRVLQAITGIK